MKIVNGISVIEGDECISRFVIESGRLDHDQNMLPLVLKHIPEGGIVLDIGAFIGDHTIAYLEKVGENGKVYAYEPSYEAYKCLEFNTANYDNKLLSCLAIGAEIGKIELCEVETNPGMNYITKTRECKKHEESYLDMVHSIDSLFIDISGSRRVDFIKIDCEGYELNVLKGGKKTINDIKPKMLIEINDMTLERQGVTRKDIFNWLDENNYSYSNIYPNQGLTDSQLDIICIPK